MSEYAKATYAEAGAEQSERANIVKEFEWATTELDKVVGDLRERLDPLLRPVHDSPEVGGPSIPVAVSPVRSQLHNLHDQTARLRSIIDRLEV